MEQNISEREQLETLRKWWDANGKAIVLGLAVGLAALFGYRYWQSMLDAKAESASLNYQHFLQLAAAGPGDEARSAGQAIVGAYPDSAYARLTSLLLARLEVDDGKLPAAKAHLQWVIDNAKGSELADVARGRLAQLLLAEGDVDAASAQVSKVQDAGATTSFAELRGDILAAQGKHAEAAAMYERAIAEVGDVGGDASHLEMKRDALGIATTTAAAK